MFNHGWWRLAVGGWWRLVAVCGGWWLAIGGWWGLVVGGWRLVAVGSWRLVVPGGGPLGRSLEKKIWVPYGTPCMAARKKDRVAFSIAGRRERL